MGPPGIRFNEDYHEFLEVDFLNEIKTGEEKKVISQKLIK